MARSVAPEATGGFIKVRRRPKRSAFGRVDAPMKQYVPRKGGTKPKKGK